MYERDTACRPPMTRRQAFIKRAGDVVFSLFAMIALSPLMLAMALIIRCEDGGAAIFGQARVTKDGRVFRILKFRTMREPAYPGEPESARLTRAGGFFRKHWLDELPQLINVLAGDMSLVGPRPESLEDVARAKRVCENYADRERVRAGLTGLAQLLGRHDTPPGEKRALDMLYIEHFSLRLDLILILQTVINIFLCS